MPVRSAELKDGKPVNVPTALVTLPWRAVGLLAVNAGLALWLIGARYTVLGAPDVLALLFGLFGIVLQLELPTGWPFLALTVAVGLVISATEFGCFPRRRHFARSLAFGVTLLVVWLLANGLDLASTFTGVTTVHPESGDAARWVAATTWAAGLWTTFLSYAPELFMFGGMKWLITGRF